ncbi:MAG: ATP-binding protein [Clostridiales bacterium]|nr:ATP-binding protein [Clostridiales bacterium]MDO4350532.1 ATP-binding protein [Eubacteriales bacterium]MDY4008541.1 ATP-binding protein [Candidatus Limiplasma sp.]
MTRDQLVMQLQQEYAQRREENLRLFEERTREACGRCPGLRELLDKRHAAVMDGVRTSLLATRKEPGRNAGLGAQIAELNRRVAALLEEGGLGGDFLQPVYTCAVCRDEGYVYDPSRRMCDCMRRELNRRLMAESGLGEGCASFEQFNASLFSGEPDEKGRVQRQVAESNRNVCQRYADRFPDTQTRDLLLMGKSGLGKTFLLQCIAKRVAQRGYLPAYTSAYRLFEAARRAYMENNGAVLAPLMDAPLLLIDDLGTEPLLNNVTVTQLFNLLNERQLAGRHTVISTNLNMSELKERYTERVTSRFLDASACTRLLFIGQDVRRSLKRRAEEA